MRKYAATKPSEALLFRDLSKAGRSSSLIKNTEDGACYQLTLNCLAWQEFVKRYLIFIVR